VYPFEGVPVEMRHFLVKNIVLQQRGPANTNRFRVFIFYIGPSGCGGQFLCDFIIYWFKVYVKNYTLNISDEKVSLYLKTTNSLELLKLQELK
jgi:hypothetical protein